MSDQITVDQDIWDVVQNLIILVSGMPRIVKKKIGCNFCRAHTHFISLWNCNDIFLTDSLWNQISLASPASTFRVSNAIIVRNKQMRQCCTASRTSLLAIPVQDQSNAILYKANYAACCDFREVIAPKFILNGTFNYLKS